MIDSLDAQLVLGLVLAGGMLARLILNVHRENSRLRAELLAAQSAARRHRQRNARRVLKMRKQIRTLDEQLSETCAALRESDDRNFEMGLELSAYRAEEQRREMARVLAWKAMAN